MKYVISIIVICYNNEKYIKKCLSSILRQANNKIELIVINDGSTDNSLNIINDTLNNAMNTKIISIKNSGISSARNIGIKESSGKFLIFVDGDDFISDYSLKYILRYIENNSFDLLLLNTTKYYEISNKYEREILEIKKNKNIEVCELINNKVFGRAWRFVYNRELIDKNNIRFHQNLIYEDEEWVPKIIFFANRIDYLDIPYYFYRKTQNTITTQKTFNNIKNLMEITKSSYEWYLKLNKKNDNNYFYFSLSRCIRNILSSMFYLNSNEKIYVRKWFNSNSEMIYSILKFNKRYKILLRLFGPYYGTKIYKCIFREKYVLQKEIIKNV